MIRRKKFQPPTSLLSRPVFPLLSISLHRHSSARLAFPYPIRYPHIESSSPQLITLLVPLSSPSFSPCWCASLVDHQNLLPHPPTSHPHDPIPATASPRHHSRADAIILEPVSPPISRCRHPRTGAACRFQGTLDALRLTVCLVVSQ